MWVTHLVPALATVVALYNTVGPRVPLWGKEVALMKRMLLATVALVMAAMMVAMALPALAAKPAPTKEECQETLVAIAHGEDLTGQQKQLVRQFPSFSECIQASSE
jgi:hypothetical protein